MQISKVDDVIFAFDLRFYLKNHKGSQLGKDFYYHNSCFFITHL